MEQTAQEIALSASREVFLASFAVFAASTAIVVVLIIILNKTVFNKNPASRPMAWGLAIVFFAVGFMTHVFVTAVAAELELLRVSGDSNLRSSVNAGLVSALALFWLIRRKEKKQPRGDDKVEGVTRQPKSNEEIVSNTVSNELSDMEIDENELYATAWEELEAGNKDKGAWVHALVDAGGDEEKAPLLYLKNRVEQLKVVMLKEQQQQESNRRKKAEDDFERERLKRKQILKQEWLGAGFWTVVLALVLVVLSLASRSS